MASNYTTEIIPKSNRVYWPLCFTLVRHSFTSFATVVTFKLEIASFSTKGNKADKIEKDPHFTDTKLPSKALQTLGLLQKTVELPNHAVHLPLQ